MIAPPAVVSAPVTPIAPEAYPERDLLAAKFTVPAKLRLASGLASEPSVNVALKSGSALTVIVSDALPRLIVSEPVGLTKVVVSKVAPLSRESVLLTPSSPSMAVLGPAGRLKMMSVAVPVLVIGSRPV